VRDRKYRAKDVLYIHDTIEAFAANLVTLREVFTNEIRPQLQPKRLGEVRNAADVLSGKVNDIAREAVAMATGRKLAAEALIETCRAGLKAIYV
jgi:hypothetical protein